MTTRPNPPGWYPRADMPGTLGYWDGSAWTDKIAPLPATPPGKPLDTWRLARGVALGIGIAAAGIVLVVKLTQPSDVDRQLDQTCRSLQAFETAHGQPVDDC